MLLYLIWGILVLSSEPLRIELIGTAAVRMCCYVVPSIVLFLLDMLLPFVSVMLKAQGEKGLPGGRRWNRIRLRELRIAGWSLFNVFLGIAMHAMVEWARTDVLGWPRALRVEVKFPAPWEIGTDLVKGLLAREFCAYVIHRYVCHSSRYSPDFLISAHREWYHSLDAPFPLTGTYDHPGIFLLTKFIPTFLPAMFFRLHLLTYFVYLAVVSIEETFAYSGYVIGPAGLFIGAIARREDLHVLRRGVGNFGPWGIFDRICGTTISEEDEEDKGLVQKEDEAQVVASKAVGRNFTARASSTARRESARYRSRRKRTPGYDDGDNGDDDDVVEVDIDGEISRAWYNAERKRRIAAKDRMGIVSKSNNDAQGPAQMRKNRANMMVVRRTAKAGESKPTRHRGICGYDGYRYDYEWHPDHD